VPQRALQRVTATPAGLAALQAVTWAGAIEPMIAAGTSAQKKSRGQAAAINWD
jgi:hypothetical protein